MWQRTMLVALALASLLTFLPWTGGQAGAAQAMSTVYVASGLANVRSGPSTSSPVVMQVYGGDPILVSGTVSGEAVSGNRTWYRTRSGYYLAQAVTTGTRGGGSVDLSGPSGERWIDVNLSTFTARAMQGNRAVYTAKIVHGRDGWRTPVGTFRVLRRAPSVTMNSATIGIPLGTAGSYLIPNVRWTQYFTNGGHAIHGNYWVAPSAFGQGRTSRGCIGMTNAAAKVFYDFSSLGTRISIHY